MKKINTIINDEEKEVVISNNSIFIDDKHYCVRIEDNSSLTNPIYTISETTCDDNPTIIDDVLLIGDDKYRIEIAGFTIDVEVEDPINKALNVIVDSKDIKSPMSGVISKILVKNGDEIKKGDTVVVISAMKMENEIKSPKDGVIKSINIKLNEQITSGQLLIEMS